MRIKARVREMAESEIVNMIGPGRIREIQRTDPNVLDIFSIRCFTTVFRGLESRATVCVMITPTVTSAVVSATGASSLENVAIASLIALLVVKELGSASKGARFKLLSRHLDVAVIPLLIVFASILIIRVVDILD